MKVDKRRITPEYEYVVVLTEKEARYIRDLLNKSPSSASKFLDNLYTADEISSLVQHGTGKSMWSVLKEALS